MVASKEVWGSSVKRFVKSTAAALALFATSLPAAADDHRTMSGHFMHHMEAVFEFQGKNQHTEAIGYINTMLNGGELDLSPYERAFLLQSRANSYYSVDLLFEAIADFQAAIDTGTLTQDETFDRRRNIAQLQHLTGQMDASIATYEQLMESGHPGTQESRFLRGLAQTYAVAEDWANASRTAEAFWAATPQIDRDSSDYRLAAFIFRQAGYTDRADDIAREGQERFPQAQ